MYTHPAIYDPNTRTAISDSGKIVRYLDRTYPDTHRLIPAELDVLIAAFEDAFWKAFRSDFAPIIIPAAFKVLRPRSRPYFRQTREAAMSGRLEGLAPIGSQRRAKCWAKLEKDASKVAAWYEVDGFKDRVFVLGDDAGLTYADVVVASFFKWFRQCLGADSEEWKDMVSWNGGRWEKLLAAFEIYEIVDAGDEVSSRL